MLHDWTRVTAGLFHHFHQAWCVEIARALNSDGLPEPYSALVEQRSGSLEPDVLAIEESAPSSTSSSGGTALLQRPVTRIVQQSERDHYAAKASRLAIRHRLGRIVALIEIVSPGNKHDERSFRAFRDKILDAIDQRIHVMVIDLFPPSPRDPAGIHAAIWEQLKPNDLVELPPNQNRVLASYSADDVNTAYVEPVSVGEYLRDMPLFIAPELHVDVPLESTYVSALMTAPRSVRRMVGAAD